MLVLTLLAAIALNCAFAQKDPHTLPGRSAIVHLFEWKFSDIAAECERFLAPMGYAGVQTSPVNEYLELTEHGRPWWERYQPISYKIISRSGDEKAFADMVTRCNNVGVRIYIDVVFNHMTGNVVNAHGYGGSTADTFNKQYYNVPFGPNDFHNTCDINYEYANEIRDCELVGLHDLNQELPYVREKIIEFLDHLVDLGVAGFRVDAAKHMWPGDLEYIYEQVKNLNTQHGFPANSRPFFYQEVPVDFVGYNAVQKTEYNNFGRVVEFQYGYELGRAFRGDNPIHWLETFGPSWGLLPSGDSLVFIDNHDTQRGAAGEYILTHKEPKLYKMAVVFMLAWPFGYPRVMSSYYFNDDDQGPPANSDGSIKDVLINSDNTCDEGWVCEHRWRQIYNMIAFRNNVDGTGIDHWWDNGSKQIAFSRGAKGFIAFNNEYGVDFKQTLQTGLPQGIYCDVISGSKYGNGCSGKSVTVEGDGSAYIQISHDDDDAMIAIHTAAKL